MLKDFCTRYHDGRNNLEQQDKYFLLVSYISLDNIYAIYQPGVSKMEH